MCKVDITNPSNESCEPTAGIVGNIYIAPVDDFVSIAEIPALSADVSQAALGTIADSHVFKEGKGFSKITIIEETAAFKADPIGETGRALYGNELTSEVAGSSASHIGASRKAKNGKYIVLFEEVESGQIRQLGSRRLPCRVKISHVIEAPVDGKNSATWVFSDKSKCAAPVYAGDIVELATDSE